MKKLEVRRHPLGIYVREDGLVARSPEGPWTVGWTGDRQGYYAYGRRVNGKDVKRYVHQLVAEAFLVNPHPKAYREIDHINRDPKDNRVENLRWASRSVNMRNTSCNDRCKARFGVNMYVDEGEYRRRQQAAWKKSGTGRASVKQSQVKWDHSQKYRDAQHKYRSTRRCVICADGRKRYLLLALAEVLLRLPVKDRTYWGQA